MNHNTDTPTDVTAVETSTIDPPDAHPGTDERGGDCAEGSCAGAPRPKRPSAVLSLGALAAVVAASYVLYQRIGTTADADVIEFSQNLGGGFVAVAMTEERPGFIVLSALERDSVDVNVQRYENDLAGDFAVASVQTSETEWRQRLRGPLVLVVTSDGSVSADVVDWSRSNFETIRDGVDCAHSQPGHQQRCGMPFADLSDLMAHGRITNVPQPMRRFLSDYMNDHGGGTERPVASSDASEDDHAHEAPSDARGKTTDADSPDAAPTP